MTVSLRSLSRGTRDLEAAVAGGDLDVAFVAAPGGSRPGLRLRPLATVPIRLVLPLGHPAASAPAVALAGDRRIDSPVGFGNRTLVDDAFATEGLRRTVGIEVADVPTIPAYVAVGVGVAIVPAYAPMDPELMHVRDVRGHQLTSSMSLATGTRRPERKVVRPFAELVEQAFASHS